MITKEISKASKAGKLLHFCNSGRLYLDIAHHNRASIAEGALLLDRFTPDFSSRLLCHLFGASTYHILLKPENTGFRGLSVWARWTKINGITAGWFVRCAAVSRN